jgi:hypothetical protein
MVINKPVNPTKQSTVLEKLIHQYEQSLMDLMALQEELRSLPANGRAQDLIRQNVEIAALTKDALGIARLRLERQQQLNAAEENSPWIGGWPESPSP